MIKQFLIITVTILSISSCKKTPQLSVAEFTCQINGVQWRGTDPEIDRSQEGIIEFTAEDTNYRFLLQLEDNGESTYDLTATGSLTTVIDLANGTEIEYSTHSGGGPNTGTLTIEEIQYGQPPYTMSGTFAFKAHKIDGASLNVVNGVFKDVPFLK